MKTDGKQFCDQCYKEHELLRIARVEVVLEESPLGDSDSVITDKQVWVLCEKCAHNFNKFISWTNLITYYDKKGNEITEYVGSGTIVSEPKLANCYVKTTITKIQPE